jgi:hypothetical protein
MSTSGELYWVGNEPSGPMKGGKYVHQLGDFHLLKKDFSFMELVN